MDGRIRMLQRQVAQGDLQAEVALLRARVRAGERSLIRVPGEYPQPGEFLSLSQGIEVAAWWGHPAARQLVGEAEAPSQRVAYLHTWEEGGPEWFLRLNDQIGGRACLGVASLLDCCCEHRLAATCFVRGYKRVVSHPGRLWCSEHRALGVGVGGSASPLAAGEGTVGFEWVFHKLCRASGETDPRLHQAIGAELYPWALGEHDPAVERLKAMSCVEADCQQFRTVLAWPDPVL